MLSKEISSKILSQLESIQQRPAMYLGKDDNVALAECYLSGYSAAAFAFLGEGSQFQKFYRQTIEVRGWEVRSVSIAVEMREKGYSEKDIVLELITTELESWRLFLD